MVGTGAAEAPQRLASACIIVIEAVLQKEEGQGGAYVMYMCV